MDVNEETSEETSQQTNDENIEKSKSNLKDILRILLVTVTVIICIIIALISVWIYYYLESEFNSFSNFNNDNDENDLFGSLNLTSKPEVHRHATVTTDSKLCANIGKDILEGGGSATDGVIGVLLCMGVTIPHTMGLGGGCLITFYNSSSREAVVIDARESAPSAASSDIYGQNETLSKYGPMAIAVPGQLYGYWLLHQKFGILPWAKLFDGAIKLAEEGFPVATDLENAIKHNIQLIKKHNALRDLFLNPKTNETYREGEILVQKSLASTLRKLANATDPIQLFYGGEITKNIINDINTQIPEFDDIKPIITEDDFASYRPRMDRSIVTVNLTRGNLTLYVPPGNGHLYSFILRVMEKFDDLYPETMMLNDTIKFYNKLIETFKYAYSRRAFLGDDGTDQLPFDNITEVVKNLTSENYINYIVNQINNSNRTFDPQHYDAKYFDIDNDIRTSYASAMDKYGNAVSVGSSINLLFGSKVYSPSTGIILNSQINGFSFPNFNNSFSLSASEYNQIKPHKRPLSFMSPAIFTDQETGDIKLLIGASGGSSITTGTALVAIRYLWFGEDIKTAIDGPRIHHQLFPNKVFYETNFSSDIINGLESFGHSVEELGINKTIVVMAITTNDTIAN